MDAYIRYSFFDIFQGLYLQDAPNCKVKVNLHSRIIKININKYQVFNQFRNIIKENLTKPLFLIPYVKTVLLHLFSMTFFIKQLKPHLLEHRILLSLMIYAFGEFFYTSVSTTFGNTIQVLGAMYFIILCINARKNIKIPIILQLCLSFIALWTFILIIRMFFIDNNSITNLTIKEAVMSFFLGYRVLPITLIFIPYIFGRRNNIDIGYYVQICAFMAYIFVLLSPLAFHNMINFRYTIYEENSENYQEFITSSTLGIQSLCPCMIVLFWKKYIPQKLWVITLLACIANLLMTMYMARRGNTVLTITYFALLWYIYTKNGHRTKKIKMIVIAIVLILTTLYIFSNYADSFFSLLIERGNENTRGGVEKSFFKHFCSTNDWLVGRGLLGTYYDEVFMDYRSSIETGYLFIILRGGLLYLIPYIILIVISGIRGCYFGKNIFVKSIAIFMLMSILELYPWGYPTFSHKFFIIWLGVYLCNTNRFLKMSDSEVQNTIFRQF